ncbi:hypothetical protein MIND_01374100 [Mycena indigotica]|uniref:Uncharacterized protein n=1 Tax=Mycena indigotica TaxID=2126181 RepID=A0A8H6RY72_9AGAR|nr:uncharacterized protein MIND_01374100 [Mycena indigotica]KAF7289131.1 hypothetical protein MIND_01374100 [Mycena indigotica]
MGSRKRELARDGETRCAFHHLRRFQASFPLGTTSISTHALAALRQTNTRTGGQSWTTRWDGSELLAAEEGWFEDIHLDCYTSRTATPPALVLRYSNSRVVSCRGPTMATVYVSSSARYPSALRSYANVEKWGGQAQWGWEEEQLCRGWCPATVYRHQQRTSIPSTRPPSFRADGQYSLLKALGNALGRRTTASLTIEDGLLETEEFGPCGRPPCVRSYSRRERLHPLPLPPQLVLPLFLTSIVRLHCRGQV